MGGSLNGKEFVEKYARRHALRTIVVENHRVYCEISEKNRGEESKHNDSKSSNVDNFYSLYH
jgi:predicted molibdopterin-dependent oxidoreductase YjgC